MGNELPCCVLGRPKPTPQPVSRPVLRSKLPKTAKKPPNLPADLAALQLVKPRKRQAVFTPHLILKLLQIDLMRKAFSISNDQLQAYGTFYVTSKVEENRKQKLADNAETEESIPAPKYDLLKVTNLPAAKQQDLAWVLAEYKETSENREMLDGFLEVKKVSRFGVPRTRILVFSTVALYVCDAKNLRAVKRRIKWEDLACVKVAPGDRSVRLELKNSEASCTLRSPQTPDITNAIKTLYHLKFKEFPTVVMAASQGELQAPVAEESIEKHQLGSQAILRKYGTPHEKVLRCVAASTLEGTSRSKMVLLISTLALYRASPEFELHSIIFLRQLKFIALVNDLSQALFQSSVGDYWVIHSEARSLVEEVEKTYLKDSGKMLQAQTMSLQQTLELFTPRPREVPQVESGKRDSNYYTLAELVPESAACPPLHKVALSSL